MEHKRVWLYCRVANEDEWALSSQQKRLEAYATQQGFTITGVSSDQAPGIHLDRPGLVEVMRAVMERKTDAVLVVSFDRIARSYMDMLQYLDFLKEHQLTIISLHDGEISWERLNKDDAR